MVYRQWGFGDSPKSQPAHETANELTQYRNSSIAPMLQRWIGEAVREQPYDNIGSVIAVSSGAEREDYSKKDEKANSAK